MRLTCISNFITDIKVIQRGSKVTSLVARSSRGRCAQHLHDTRTTWRTSYANFARNICVTYAPDSRRMRVTSANPAHLPRNKICYIWTPLYARIPNALRQKAASTSRPSLLFSAVLRQQLAAPSTIEDLHVTSSRDVTASPLYRFTIVLSCLAINT
jgi:hypothetical protein